MSALPWLVRLAALPTLAHAFSMDRSLQVLTWKSPVEIAHKAAAVVDQLLQMLIVGCHTSHHLVSPLLGSLHTKACSASCCKHLPWSLRARYMQHQPPL